MTGFHSEKTTIINEFDLSPVDVENYFTIKRRYRDQTVTGDIIRVLWEAPDKGTRFDVLCREVAAIREVRGQTLSRCFGRVVQSNINLHTRQSIRWNRQPETDLFHSPNGKGSGTWVVDHSRAVAWLKTDR